MADQQDHRSRRLEELEDENGILRENLARYKALEESMLSQKVYENARRALISWLSFGGLSIFFLGYIGFQTITDQILKIVVPRVEKIATKDVKEALKPLTQDFNSLKAEIFWEKFSGAKGTRQLRSQRGDTQIEIEFVNKLDEMVVVYWIDYKGKENEYFELQPGESKKQKTYVTHPWIVKKGKSQKPVGSIIGELQGKRLVIESSAEESGN